MYFVLVSHLHTESVLLVCSESLFSQLVPIKILSEAVKKWEHPFWIVCCGFHYDKQLIEKKKIVNLFFTWLWTLLNV